VRQISVILVLLFCVNSTINISSDAVDFEGGLKDLIISLDSPGFSGIAEIEIPAGYYSANATMNIAGLAAGGNLSSYPENVLVSLNGSIIWAFNSIGYGQFGRQDRFANDLKKETCDFGSGGGTINKKIRLPKESTISGARMGIKSVPSNSGLNPGGAYIFFGGQSIQDNPDVKLTGIMKGDRFGWSVSGAGDVNNDGYDDVIVGAYRANVSGTVSGQAYLYFGGSKMNITPDIIFTGDAAWDAFGYDVSSAGDVNCDGYADVIIGAHYNGGGGTASGSAYLYFGGGKMDNNVDMIFTGAAAGDRFGSSVSSAGDANGDGYGDLIIGAPQINGGNDWKGQAYVFFGGKNMDNASDVTFNGNNSDDLLGRSVSSGDINGDGYTDVIVGALGGSNLGYVNCYFGSQNMDNIVDISYSGSSYGDRFGFSVSGAGDVNNDGFQEIVVGAYANNDTGNISGKAYLYSKSNEILNFQGSGYKDWLGWSVSGSGDVNNDGYDDIIIGAIYNDSTGNNSGAAYIHYGGPNMDNIPDVNLSGNQSKAWFGASVSSAGDVNNDGYDDVIVGAYNASINNSISGILDPSILIGSRTIWNLSGSFNGSAEIGDFAQILNQYISSVNASGMDEYGNLYVDIPLSVKAESIGNISLYDLEIVYDHNATIRNFTIPLNRYLSAHQNDKNVNGNVIVPIDVSSKTAGRIGLFNLQIGLFCDQPPSLAKDIGTAYMDEDVAVVSLIDLYQHFKDDLDPVNNLAYSVVSATNSSFVRLWITANRYLSADALTGTANDNWTGTVQAKVACGDRSGLRTESNFFTIVVRNVNDPPLITSSAPLKIENGVPYFYNVTAVDGDSDLIGYHLLKAPPDMTIDGRTGQIAWMRPVRGNHEVNVQASDGNDGSDVQIFHLLVGNIGPRITSAAPFKGETWVRYVYNVTAEDPDEDRLTFSLDTNAVGMQINGTTGVLTWTPQFAGRFSATVFASDGEESDRQDFTITVIQGNNAPRFVTRAVVSATVGIPYTYTAMAVDDDGDSVVYTVLNAPPGMTIGDSNGIISWTPAATGNYPLTVIASDGRGAEARQEFTIVVTEKVKVKLEIARPSENERVKGKVRISGTAARGTLDVAGVQVRVDGGKWTNATGTGSWEFVLDTARLKNGPHILEARAFDGADYSDAVNRTMIVDNQKAQGKGFIPGFSGMAALVAVMACAALLAGKRAWFH